MKFKVIFFLFIIIVQNSCVNSTQSGYFKSNIILDNNTFNVNKEYYRINHDTIVSYKIANQRIDSIVHYWDGKGYIRLGEESEKLYGNFGGDKLIVIDQNKITFDNNSNIDKLKKIKDTNSVEALILKVLIKKDTLTRITKKYFYHFLDEDKKKDSILFNSPYISDYIIKSTVSQFIKEKIVGEIYGNLILNSISINRVNNDSFRVSFKTVNKFNFKEDHRFIFDANMENWDIKRN